MSVRSFWTGACLADHLHCCCFWCCFFHLPVPSPWLTSDSNHGFLFPKQRLTFENLSLVSLLEFASFFLSRKSAPSSLLICGSDGCRASTGPEPDTDVQRRARHNITKRWTHRSPLDNSLLYFRTLFGTFLMVSKPKNSNRDQQPYIQGTHRPPLDDSIVGPNSMIFLGTFKGFEAGKIKHKSHQPSRSTTSVQCWDVE